MGMFASVLQLRGSLVHEKGQAHMCYIIVFQCDKTNDMYFLIKELYSMEEAIYRLHIKRYLQFPLSLYHVVGCTKRSQICSMAG